ncbi:Ubiquitin-like superfamily protein [Hibiscus syriacus]|uniref:Ubiquitin-like superfamily protein n=1 Tax=Hibiscus syriacus TaxID=106335 RepID=A0A6A2ZQJ2_HIBSY|nr:Ubiquitin-like superfamily protein [Hibiscus syriacus]
MCVACIRFICNDHCCCICKAKSHVIFVTKLRASIFVLLIANVDFKLRLPMIKAMCRLSFTVCDNMEEQTNDGPVFGRTESLAFYITVLNKIHFRHDHYLCEDEACLAKKFIVFQSEAELKRQNTIEHGGRMSRAQRTAALQIPTSFRFHRRNDDHRRGMEQMSWHEPSDDDYQLSMTIEASLEATSDPPGLSTTQVISYHGDINDIEPLVQPFELLSATDSESSSRYLQALGGGSRGAPLQETYFPPLSTPASNSQQIPKHRPDGLPFNTMAAHLRRRRMGLSYASSSHVQIQVQSRPTTADILKASGSRMSAANTNRINHSSSAPNLADGNGLQVNGEAQGRGWFKYNNASKKWKGKSLNTTGCNSKDKVADCIINQCMQIAVAMPSGRPTTSPWLPGELHRDNGRLHVPCTSPTPQHRSPCTPHSQRPTRSPCTHSDLVGHQAVPATKLGCFHADPRHITCMLGCFHIAGSAWRPVLGCWGLRLGYGSMAALLDPKDSEPNPEPEALDNKLDSSQNSSGALPVRGVWKKGGSKKLFS